MRYSVSVIITCCLGLFLIIQGTTPSYGKALVLSPDNMLQYADVIFTGNIIRIEKLAQRKNEPGPYVVKLIHVKVDQILKGNLDSDIAILKQSEGGLAVHQNYPDSKKEKMLILQRKLPDNTLTVVADSNNIGIIQEDRVVEVLNNPNDEYVSVFDQFYQAQKANAKKPPQSINSAASSISYSLVAVAGALILSCGIVQLRRKK
ncbi:hypothetical protein FE784_36830 [Paenibacillus hemerocallicola]|uniref:Uncharacterized protein n=1 Tax=Paenibacillus hemerocallicola TaxID=1172614 RepID=A0A5C4SXP6_9BACL|nr:hypothetical protein [Paenibacillus hemerocallicola]TNJ59895.1 hypothetical protein FE784_36830 [Paenibacillus hemerocallicola]